MADYSQKIKSVPKHIRQFMTSVYNTENNLRICRNYGIKGGKIKVFTELMNSLFFKELKLEDLSKKIMNKFDFDEKNAKKLTLDIAGMKLLVIGEWYGGQVEKLIIDNGGRPQEYRKYPEEHEKAIEREKKEFENEWKEEKFVYKPPQDPETVKYIPKDKKIEKKETAAIFQKDLSSLLNSKDNPALEEYNALLIEMMAEEKDFKLELEKNLLANQEKLTKNDIRLEKASVDPTIANWLKDFIKYHGTDDFSNVVLSKYISRSDNCKKLNEEEKKLIRKLLILYRNIKFFPDSLKNLPPEAWEIIPVQKNDKDYVRPGTLDIPKTKEEKEIDRLKLEEKKYEEESLERAALEEEIENKQDIESLRAEAGKYKDGSLEKRAIEEEIRKLSR